MQNSTTHYYSVPCQIKNGNSITLHAIDPHSLELFKRMCNVLFPVNYSAQFFDSLLTEPGHYVFFIYNGAVCIGLCAFSVADVSAYLLVFGILPEFRGRMFGTRALRFFEEYAYYYLRLSSVWLHVQTSNACAKNFYYANGYILSGLEADYYVTILPRSAFVLRKSIIKDYMVPYRLW